MMGSAVPAAAFYTLHVNHGSRSVTLQLSGTSTGEGLAAAVAEWLGGPEQFMLVGTRGYLVPRVGRSLASCGVRTGDTIQVVPYVNVARCPRSTCLSCWSCPLPADCLNELLVIIAGRPAAAVVCDSAALCDALDLVADSLDKIWCELWLNAATMRQLALRPRVQYPIQRCMRQSQLLLRSPTLLMALSKMLSTLVSARTTPMVGPADAKYEHSGEWYRQQFVVYGNAMAAPERPLSAAEMMAFGEHEHLVATFSDLRMFHMMFILFCIETLKRGAAMILIHTQRDTAVLLQSLSTSLRMDTERLLASNRIITVDAESYYTKDMNPAKTVERVQGIVKEQLRTSGAATVRFMGEPHCPAPPFDRQSFYRNVVEYERQLDTLTRVAPLSGICIYNASALPASVVGAVLHVHRACVAPL
eukprot:TRINITY_DN2397_c0_g1_i4.p1 TRINITY_DN2397_c0_g1~~TRINITY_DN2397_c0_g1_i4.p1  ORF type:complete len:435 (-),score=66.64 TRINITY_DN2397_c0_g1_i4:49-1299(-)